MRESKAAEMKSEENDVVRKNAWGVYFKMWMSADLGVYLHNRA